MLDAIAIYKIIKEAGYLPVNITDGVTDHALNDDERRFYLARRQQWAASRPKVVLILSRNEITGRLFFEPGERDLKHVPAHVYLYSKRGGFSVVRNAGPLPIIAFVKGLTERCQVCRASTDERGLTCNGCGYSQCDTCFKKSSVANGITCRRCKGTIGDVDLGSTMMAAVTNKKGQQAGQLKVNLTTTRPTNGLPTTVAEVRLPRQAGTRAEATRLYIDPNMQPGDNTMLYVCHHRGLTMAQPIIDTYCQRLNVLSSSAGKPCNNVVLCLIGGADVDMLPVTTLSNVMEVLEQVAETKSMRLIFKQSDSAWKAAEKLLQRNMTTGTFGFVASLFFPNEAAIRTELFIVHEIVKDLLVLTNGWICAQCQKPAARKRCSRCGVMRYCSEECYAAHWGIHEGMCNGFVENRMLCEAMTKIHEDM